MTIKISVIIPAYNEERCLPGLLADIAQCVRLYPHGAAAVEVIVADNGSTDDTASIARASGYRVVSVRPRCIGAVRNGGAAAARGEIVAFVDADTRLHRNTFIAIDEYFANGDKIVGATGVLPERRSLGIDATWFVLGLISAVLGYGIPRARHQCAPTGLVCCRRADWVAVGGYSERLMFAEDVRFLLDLKRLGRKRRQKVGWLRDVPATFSTRKFDEHGDWHYLIIPFRMLLGLVWYPALQKWVDRYWYGRQRDQETLP